jgi:uncharacterized protein YfaQ (DUF2300 family)
MALTAEQHSETWLQLSEATVLIDHDRPKARQRLERAIKKAWLVPAPGLPQPPLDPNVPLRIQVTPPAGLRIDGRAWLDNTVLDWEASETECLCKPWSPARQACSSTAETQCRARIEVWGGDLVRLWGSNNAPSNAFKQGNNIDTADERGQKPEIPPNDEIYGY